MKLHATLDGKPRLVELEIENRIPRRLLVDGQVFELDAREVRPGVFSILIGLRSFEVCVGQDADGGYAAQVESFRHHVRIQDPRKFGGNGALAGALGRQEIRAPMPGKIIRVLVDAGSEVEAGAGLFVVEAMKMQNEVKAASAARVTEVRVSAGDLVSAGQVLAVLE